MKETKLQSDELAVIANNQGLKMYLHGLSIGKDATPRSNLYNLPDEGVKVLTPDEILDEWMQTLKRLDNGDEYSVKVFQFDSHQLEKWGPQGQKAPINELLEEIVYPSFSEVDSFPAFSTPEWQRAKERVKRELFDAGCHSMAPVSYENVLVDMRVRDTLESNSGWPDFTRRSKPEVRNRAIQDARNGQWKTYPAIALLRNYNCKTRLVWMFPMSANLVEGSFFQPLQSRLMQDDEASRGFLSPWRGFETVRERMTTGFAFGAVAASDFSSTDAHFKLTTSMEVFDVLQYCFQPRYRDALKESIQYMHRIPLVISATTKLEGWHGVSSGSNWTNFIETIFDWILSEYVRIMQQKELYSDGAPYELQKEMDHYIYSGLYAIGDDMAWWADEYDPEFASKLAAWGESAGQVIKAEKTVNNPDDVVSLQRLFVRDVKRPDGLLKAVYPTIRALKSLVYPEKFHKPKLWSKDMEAVRAFMILENCVDHPLFEEFCRFVAAGDPNLVTVAKMKYGELNKLLRQSKLVPGLNPTYNQEKRDSSLANFACVKFISENC